MLGKKTGNNYSSLAHVIFVSCFVYLFTIYFVLSMCLCAYLFFVKHLRHHLSHRLLALCACSSFFIYFFLSFAIRPALFCYLTQHHFVPTALWRRCLSTSSTLEANGSFVFFFLCASCWAFALSVKNVCSVWSTTWKNHSALVHRYFHL